MRNNRIINDTDIRNKALLLKGKTIAIAVTGGIGAVEVIKIIREFRRLGATVFPFLTKSAKYFVTPLSVSWAADREAVISLKNGSRHLDDYSAVLVVPATLNTIIKASLGISDTVVTLLIAAQFGKKVPVFFVPSMHIHLKNHPGYESSKKTLESWGSFFLEKEPQEDRLKIPSAQEIVSFVLKYLE